MSQGGLHYSMNKLIIPFLFIACFIITACSDDEPTSPTFIQNAHLKEQGQTLSPGDIVHLEGEGYIDTDQVLLSFYWATGDKLIPEGCIKGYNARILQKSANEMIIQLPYRKPSSRIDISLLREGQTMAIGSVNITDGTTSKEMNLYGITNHSKSLTSENNQITRWLKSNTDKSDMERWSLYAHPDFHSAVGAYRAYGVCGLSKENSNQYPYFLDLLTGQWEKLSECNTIALYSNANDIYALQSSDGLNYGLYNISSTLERSDDYKTVTRANAPMPNQKHPLPNGLKAEHFGDYPGMVDTSGVLLSANKGDGIWTPVIFHPEKGFYVGEDIEADALIPFSVFRKSESDKSNYQRITGYVVTLKNHDDSIGSLIYLKEDGFTFAEEPFATFPNKALSIAANPDTPGVLTVYFEAYRSGYIAEEFMFDSKEWKPINEIGTGFDEIVWIN